MVGSNIFNIVAILGITITVVSITLQLAATRYSHRVTEMNPGQGFAANIVTSILVIGASKMGVPRYFFSSSVCVYRDMQPGEPEMTEAEAIPAHPDNEYGWEKLYSERIAEAYERNRGMQVRIARLAAFWR